MIQRRHLLIGGLALAGLAAAALSMTSAAGETTVVLAPPALDAPAAGEGLQTAVLAGGCFWGVQAVFQHTRGVVQAVSGYAGGTVEDPGYQQVTTGATGHAEAVQITYDPRQISYGKLLHIFFSVVHDPTQLDRQGPDVGTQYRSHIFYADEQQKQVAEAYIAQLEQAGVYGRPIVTRLDPMPAFYPAEDYHQDFATLHPDHPYIAYHDLPKIAALRKLFLDVYRDQPALVGVATN
jgi:peptide-methionine (S)-S-oxide reductase